MKPAIILDGFDIGGTELNATRTLEALGRRGIALDVLHFHEDGPLRQRIVDAGHRLHHVPIVPLSSPRIAARILALAQVIRRTNATLVHTQDVYSNILGVAASRYLARRPVLSSRRWKDDVPRKGLTPLNAWAHRRSTLVLPNSPTLVPTLAAEGVHGDHIAVHENFVDDSALDLLTEDARRTWRTRLGLPADALVVGCVARLGRVKRHDVLLAAFAQVRAQVPDCWLVLVGDGASRLALESQARELGIAGRTIFTGTLPNTPLPQQLFDVAVLTSENEGFPNALVEASASGVALVASSVGGVPDVLEDQVTGLAVKVADIPGTAEAIVSLMQDPATRQRMGEAGRRRVRERFSESAAMTRLLRIYEGVSC